MADTIDKLKEAMQDEYFILEDRLNTGIVLFGKQRNRRSKIKDKSKTDDTILFKDIKGVGTLRIDYVLLEYEEMPVLFTCINENKTIYLCHLNEIRECLKWNIAEISQDTLRELLFKQIDIKTALTTKPIIFIIEADNEKEISYAQETAKVNPLDLPKENTYLRIDEDEANKYLADSEKRLSNNK